ncbi:hypothetical protein L7F22_023811 [Adiantum nelumboides]|nr:hypothetical protein [Adiantum nelumboides]
MSQSQAAKVGGLGGSGRVQESKAFTASQGKDKAAALAAAAVRRSNMLMSRATRVKVWEERIEEEEEEVDEEVRDMESLPVHHANNSFVKGKVRGSVQMQVKAVVGGGGSKKKGAGAEEIGVFDAERYFGGAEQPAGWAGSREIEEDELMEGEAGGDLPLSPLVEIGKGQLWRWRSDGGAGAGGGGPPTYDNRRPAAPQAAPGVSVGGRRRVESSEFTSPRTSNASSTLSEVEPQSLQRSSAHTLLNSGGKLAKNKVQLASPSGRLANFLAKFKAPTPRKSPAPLTPCSPTLPAPITSASATPPPSHPRPRAPGASVLSPAKKLFPHYSPGIHPAQPKTSSASPRGRFLRAFSSSSADHASSGLSLRHHSAINAAANTPASMPAAYSPVSPAARSAPPDPYSPVAHSASTTPTSSRLPRLSAHSANYSHHQYGTSKSNTTASARPQSAAALGHCNSSSGSFKQQLPSLSRKLKVYLMPEKLAAHSGKHEKSPVIKTAARGHEFGLLRQYTRHTQELGAAKQRRRWLHAEDQVVDEDIELAERLLRVVQDHQSFGMGQQSKFCLLGEAIKGSSGNNKGNNNSTFKKSLYVDGVSEYSSRKYDQMHRPSSTVMLPHAVAGHGAMMSSRSRGGPYPHHQHLVRSPDLQLPAAAESTDDEASQQQLLYDSDSSSDLFEIESLASSVGMGLYARRDLPVYEAKEEEEVVPFSTHNSFSFAKPGAR